jgi:hypothetical protein
MSKDLVEQIVELRADVERELKANKYYIALGKLDELLAAIRPVEAEIAAAQEESRNKTEAEPEPVKAAEADADGDGERVWTGTVRETVVDEARPL